MKTYARTMISIAGIVVSSVTQTAENLTAAVDGEMQWFCRRWHDVAIIEISLQK